MKPPISLIAAVLGLWAWQPARAADPAPAYSNDFQAEALDKLPADFMVMSGAFTVKSEGANRFLELPGSPLDSFGLLFGPESKDGGCASARFFGSKQGRKFPTFGLSLLGVGGYRLQVSPGKKALEIYRGDDLKSSIAYEWTSESWTRLRLQVRKKPGGAWIVEGRAWNEAGAEPAAWMIFFEDPEQAPTGRAGIWGSPFSGTPIRFDDLAVTPAK